MTSEVLLPPLHRRHDAAEAWDAIETRYIMFQRKLQPQISVLQESESFRKQCATHYGRGYKDWMILGAVLNRWLNFAYAERGLDPSDGPKTAQFAKTLIDSPDPISKVYEAQHFCGDFFEHFLMQFNAISLRSYGFEPRQRVIVPEKIEWFLRNRLNHFEKDLPHEPLFGAKPGTWPGFTV